ncbi:hypothetical protein [Smaragdicoccus niigatensis]|uniref:hypothetical protein n=1 Tax=Smaragdicoccus niigatensis TaxID=359359 RepID=UPI00035F69B7|nr:hypothetical protein [Smaragdicoccus niigatensis]
MRHASIWTIGPDGLPRIATDHPRIDAATARRVVDYLRAGRVVVATTARVRDVLDSSVLALVGLSTRCDNEWSWDDTLLYYVENHLLSPGQEFLDYLTQRTFTPNPPSAEAVAHVLSNFDNPHQRSSHEM